ncbi:MAG: ABC transporter ATP-binding protein [Deltaproteobacteria bacterium]|nr:ABC transporter ATP-binding protein [Deltaproteobacteria bacterium]MCL5276819.1 ABC transporter ATP-binding protein [Deltaproteobacteria bacterium]
MDRTLVSLRGISKFYENGSIHALEGIDLDISDGDFIAITGPSGSGKSTLLSIIGGLELPTSGAMLVGREPLSSKRIDDYRHRFIGFVFQAFYLMPTLTALENVQMPMFGVIKNGRQRTEKARSLLDAVGLSHRKDHLPQNMSGGERQRVAIARSLANDPSLILADEPTGNLDSVSSAAVLDTLKRINEASHTAIVLVTHEAFIAHYAHRIVRLKDGRLQ